MEDSRLGSSPSNQSTLVYKLGLTASQVVQLTAFMLVFASEYNVP